jgi:hypothetical protein
LAFSTANIVARSSGELTSSAVPSTTTGFCVSSVATTHRESAIRFLDLRDPLLLLNHNIPSCHIPHTGMVCGRPSGHTLTSQ